MKKGYWVVRTYVAGKVAEKIKYWVDGERPTRSDRKMRSDIRKIQQNEAGAVKRVARLLNANFKKGDILLGLDYDAESYSALCSRSGAESAADQEEAAGRLRMAAEKELENCIRRVQYELKKEGKEIKYIAVTSDMDGDTGEDERIHHHLVINAAALDAFLRKWGGGGVSYERLRDQPDYLPIAEYLIRQVRYVPDAKAYKPSRNLVQVKPKDRIVNSGAELRLPRGAKMLHRAGWSPGRPQYMRYLLPPQEEAPEA